MNEGEKALFEAINSWEAPILSRWWEAGLGQLGGV